MKSDLERRVSRILFEFDPMGLRSVDVPEDEYDFEARMIVERVSAGEELTANLVQEIFAKMYSPLRIDDTSSIETFEKIVWDLRPLFAKNDPSSTASS